MLSRTDLTYYTGELDKGMQDAKGASISAMAVLQNKIVVVVGDSVPDEDSAQDELAGRSIYSALYTWIAIHFRKSESYY